MNTAEIIAAAKQSHSSPQAAFTAMHWPRKPLPKGKSGGKVGKMRGGSKLKKS